MNYLEKKKKLPPDLYDFLSSDNPRWEIERVVFMYGLTESNIKKISFPIALIFVGDYQLKNYPEIIKKDLQINNAIISGIAYEINKRIFNKFPEYFKDSSALLEEWGRMKVAPVISEEAAWQKVLEVEPWILELENEKRAEGEAEQKRVEEKRATLTQMKLQEALKKYEKLGEQHLSGNSIKLKIFESPVRPSIKNWISDYYENVDARKHDSIERGNYLFHSENARRLTTGERQKVGTMLRALDEDSLVAVDPERQEMVFGNNGEEMGARGEKGEMVIEGVKRAETGIRSGMDFSSNHKFPFEQNVNRSVVNPGQKSPQPPFLKGEIGSAPRQAVRHSNNVVDLRE